MPRSYFGSALTVWLKCHLSRAQINSSGNVPRTRLSFLLMRHLGGGATGQGPRRSLCHLPDRLTCEIVRLSQASVAESSSRL